MLRAIRQNAFPIFVIVVWMFVAAWVLSRLAPVANAMPVIPLPEVVITVEKPSS